MRVRRKSFKTIRVVLYTGETAIKGNLAAIDTADGLARDGDSASTTLLPIGRFAEDLALGDSSATVLIDLFEEVWAHGFLNDDSPNDIDSGDLWSEVYIKDAMTVSTSSGSSTRSKAGRVIAIEGDYVYVQAGVAVTGPSGLGSDFSAGVADKAALSAIAAVNRYEGMIVTLQSDGSIWRFDSDGTATEDEGQELIVEPDAGDGQWVAADKYKVVKLPIDYSMSDGDAILTVPAGFVLRLVGQPFWEVTTGFTGGSSSAIGVSTSLTGYEAGGDVLGGASGDVAATLVAGIANGTIGDELGDETGFKAMLFVEGDELQFDAITSAFTAGEGFVCVPFAIMHPAA